MNSKKTTRLLSQAVLISLIFWMVGSINLWANGQQDAVDKTHVQVPPEIVIKILVPASTSAIPFFWLAEINPLPGVDLQVEVFISHPKALADLLLGHADFILTGTTQGWNNYLDKSPLVIINTGIWGLSYLIGKDRNIRHFADIKGKTIALPFPGAPLDFQTRYLLEANGIKEQEVKIIYAPFTQVIPLLLSGQIASAPLPEPLATEVVENKGLNRLLDYKIAWAKATGGDGFSPQVSLFALSTKVREKHEFIIKLIDSWQRATKEVQQQPGFMSTKYADLLGINPEVLTTAINNTLYFVPTFKDHKQRINEYFNFVSRFSGNQNKELGEDFFF